ncbi:MAG: metal-sensitive transcriptional regulator [Stellaceae bacterium]
MTAAAAARSNHAGHLHLDAGVREDARRRLLSVRGHIEGVLKMLEKDDVYCVDVLKQLRAVEGAISKTGELVLRSHLRNHVVSAAQRGDADALVDELMEYLKYRR